MNKSFERKTKFVGWHQSIKCSCQFQGHKEKNILPSERSCHKKYTSETLKPIPVSIIEVELKKIWHRQKGPATKNAHET